MGLALIEKEKLEKEKSLRTASKTGKPVTKGVSGGPDRRRLLLQLDHPQVQARVLKLHPELMVVGMSAYHLFSTDLSEEVNSQEEAVRRSATGT